MDTYIIDTGIIYMDVKEDVFGHICVGSHGLSAAGTKDEVKQARRAQSRPVGPLPRSRGPEGP